MTSSNWYIFRVTCSVTDEFPSQRPVMSRFNVFFDLRLNKRLNKHSRRWWFEKTSRPLWRHWKAWLRITVFLGQSTWWWHCSMKRHLIKWYWNKNTCYVHCLVKTFTSELITDYSAQGQRKWIIHLGIFFTFAYIIFSINFLFTCRNEFHLMW